MEASDSTPVEAPPTDPTPEAPQEGELYDGGPIPEVTPEVTPEDNGEEEVA